MKKIAVLLTVVICVCTLFASCGANSTYKNAPVEGYDESFYKTLEKTANKVIDAIKKESPETYLETKPSFSLSCKTGWEGEYAPDASELDKEEEAVTFVIKTTMSDETVYAEFYLVYDKNDKELEPEGGCTYDAKGNGSSMSKEEVERLIKTIYKGDMGEVF